MRTSFYSILCIVIRLGAVFLAFGALARVPSTIIAWKHGVSAAAFGFAALSIALVLLLALVLWTWPGLIARVAAGRNSREVFESPISPAELQWIALGVLGVYFAVGALVTLAHYGMQWAMLSTEDTTSDDYRLQLFFDAIYYAFELVAGLALAFGARGLTALLRRARYGDPARYESTDEPDRPSRKATR